MFEFTTTATCRPDIYRRTLESFNRNLLGVRLCESRLYLNVDPVPAGIGQHLAVNVARDFFADVRPNLPAISSFPAAVKWCLSQPSGPAFFYLEDDWELTAPIEIEALRHALAADRLLAAVNLRTYAWPQSDRRICLSPSLWRTAAAHDIAEQLTTDWNPERQLRPVTPENPHGGRHGSWEGVRLPREPFMRVLTDIGRDWLSGAGWRKDAAGMEWTRWEAA